MTLRDLGGSAVPAHLKPDATVGPRDWFEADTANLLYLNHMLVTGRVPHAGHRGPQAMQRLLRTARWDADGVRDDVRGYVAGYLGHRDGVLIVDETGFLKKGARSAGVQRQYTGTAGRIENSQVGVFLAYATPRGRALIDRRLYLPEKTWCADVGRRARAGIPDDLGFATKPALALEMIIDALDAAIPTRWVTGDEVYGAGARMRGELEHRGVGYVLAVACDHQISRAGTKTRADVVAAGPPASAWHRYSAGLGAKGPSLDCIHSAYKCR